MRAKEILVKTSNKNFIWFRNTTPSLQNYYSLQQIPHQLWNIKVERSIIMYCYTLTLLPNRIYINSDIWHCLTSTQHDLASEFFASASFNQNRNTFSVFSQILITGNLRGNNVLFQVVNYHIQEMNNGPRYYFVTL